MAAPHGVGALLEQGSLLLLKGLVQGFLTEFHIFWHEFESDWDAVQLYCRSKGRSAAGEGIKHQVAFIGQELDHPAR